MSFISKSDYMDLFLRYAAPLTKHIRDGGLYIGEQAAVYKESTARTEGFLRVLWGLVPFIAGGGECDKLLKLYNKGFHEGTDKTSPAYWGDCTDFDQLFVAS